MALTLTIYHNLFLDREQRYALTRGEDVTVVGVSVPVWYEEPVSTEPAREVFCLYVLKNQGEDQPIKIEENGYEIVLPQKPNSEYVNPELLASLSPDELRHFESLEGCAATGDSLLDIKDGGSASMYYREHNKVSSDGRSLHIVHFVHIRDISVLLNSIESE